MHEYINYCTEEQTRRAWKLGAPLENFDPDNSNGIICGNDGIKAIPTTQEMIGWLRDAKRLKCFVDQKNNVNISIVLLYNDYEKSDEVVLSSFENDYTYEQAELATIDAALDYLEKKIESIRAIGSSRKNKLTL